MIKSLYLNKEFATAEEMFDYITLNKDVIIANKKSQIMKSVDKGTGIPCFNLKYKDIPETIKADFNYDENYYLVVNMAGILDSHEDLHIDGIWNKTVKDRQGKNYLVLDHELSVAQTVVRKEYITMMVKNLPYTAIGKSYNGSGDALIYVFPKDKVINAKAKEWLDSGDDIQASVRMRYVDVDFAYNSVNENYKKEKENYDKYINFIANKEELGDIYYFTIVKQAENVYESSLVLFGSNSSTGILNGRDEDNREPHHSTHKENNETVVDLDTVRQALKQVFNNN